MGDNEFNVLKNMINELNTSFFAFQEKALGLIAKNNDRLIKLEQIYETETNYKKRFLDSLLKIIPIILTIALVIKAFWGK